MNNTLKNRFALVILIASLFLVSACGNDDGTSADSRAYGIFIVLSDNVTVEMDGDIGSAALNDFNSLISDFPDVNKINMIEVSGSLDDEINLQVAALVHQRGISIHLVDNGLIASGGTDFFLAGTTRTIGTGTQIGVHSWSDGENEATDYAVGHQFHEEYIDFYISIGFSRADAEAFYYFTINAASADDIHWMTAAEIDQYGVLKP